MSYSQEALDEFYKGNLDKTDELIKKAQEYDDDDTLFNLADNLLEMGQSIQAREIFEDLLTKNPDADELRTRLAEIAVSDDQMDLAINYLAEVKPDSYAYGQALITSADVYQAMGLYEVSEQKLLEALKLFPDEEVIKFALAELYFAQANFEKAISFYEVLLDDKQEEFSGISIHERIGDALAGNGKFEEAIEVYEKINQLMINEDILFKKATLYYQTHELKKAQQNLDELIELNHDYIPAYSLLANVLYEQEQYEEAYRTAMNGINFDEYNYELYKVLLKAAKKTKHLAEAIELAKKGINRVEESNELVKEITDYYQSIGDYDQVISLIKKVQKNEDDDPYLFWNLAKAYSELDEISAARDNILLAYNDLQDNADFLRDLVLILRDFGDLKTAKDALQRYLKLNPDDEYMKTLFDN
ncbi:tetratricopeptide repeat protein [Lactobacillus sp. YT155]|uniref:tetratricopeptide repeat protein n=1 Tax=Lactobacillus sp. YT155 TaxID=3060955 RepID=UPI00265D704F|nr:tetratricopeptide repeat protein [Lactobacillus sp. YT155]MDO1605386.1 tetratricopeptide repeat protein [Lactobacillus sp. YT155]